MNEYPFVTYKIPEANGLTWSLYTELFFIADGTMELNIGEDHFVLHTGDLAVVNCLQLYSLENIHGLCLQLSMDFGRFAIYCGFKGSPFFHLNTANAVPNPDGFGDLQTKPLRGFLLQLLYDIAQEEKTHPLLRKRDEFNLLTELLLHFSVPAASHQEQAHLLNCALLYISQNYTSPIRIQDIAQHCHISNAYLSHLFQSALKTSPSGFLLKTRLQHAKQLLAQPLTLTQAAAASGFGNARNLNAAFRKIYGILPADYRKQASSPANSPSGLNLRDWMNTHFMPPLVSCHTATAPVDTPPAFRLPEHYLDLLEFGAASRLLDPSCRNFLKECQEQFYFRYIRLTGIFDNTLLSYIATKDEILWDFSNLDQIFEFILSIGLTPMITISSIPNVLSSIDTSNHFGFSNVSYPTDMEKWRSLIHSFLTHLLEQFGSRELSTWKIGIWFLSSFSVMQGGGSLSAKEYIHILAPYFSLYREAFQVIRSLSPQTDIGCPEGDLEDLLKSDYILEWIFCYFRENNCCPDYFIFHDNWGLLDQELDNGREMIFERHISISDSSAQVALLCNRINRYSGKETPIYCSCWRSIHYGAPINETVFAASALAAYLLKNTCHLAMVGLGPYQDLPILPEKSATDFCGGWGFVTGHKLRRPFYHVLLELRKLQPNVVYSDSHAFITIGTGGILVYLYNVPDFSYQLRLAHSALQRLPVNILAEDYFYPRSHEPLFTDIKNATTVTGGNPLDITLLLQGLPAKEYLLETISINEHHGSVYDEWIREGAFTDFTLADYEGLASRSLPARSRKRIRTAGGEYRLECRLAPSEIRVVSLMEYGTAL